MLSNDELQIMLKARRGLVTQIIDRARYRAERLEQLGIDKAQDLELFLLNYEKDKISCEIVAIKDELKQRSTQSLTRTERNVPNTRLVSDGRDAIERMMRGNYNKYGGEDI